MIGLAGALALTDFIGSLLYGVSPRDLPTLSAVIAVTMVVGMVVALLPARRATRVDPLIALRQD